MTIRNPKSAIQNGFTLIELLVVVTIIIALLALLMPAINGAIKSAERAACESNLHQFGIGNLAWASDHFSRVMVSSPRTWPYDIYKSSYDDERWAIPEIDPYVSSFTNPDGTIDSTGIAVCPATETEIINQWHDVLKNSDHVEIVYTYFGGLAERFDDPLYGGGGGTNWNIKNGAEKILMTRQVGSADRIWMSDVFYNDRSDDKNGINPWRYNHGENGWSLNWLAHPPGQGPTVPLFTGLNQLMGDGHVRWKPREVFLDVETMGNWGGYEGPGRPYIRSGQDRTFF